MEGTALQVDHQDSILELKHKLLCTCFELETAKSEAKLETRQYEEIEEQLVQNLKEACQERDEVRQKIKKLLDQSHVSAAAAAASSEGVPKKSLVVQRDQMPDEAVMENLIKGKPLPQRGKLWESVIKAGPLLDTLLLDAGPLHHWQSRPPPPPPLQILPVSAIPFEDYYHHGAASLKKQSSS